jgi:hypothetical protein
MRIFVIHGGDFRKNGLGAFSGKQFMFQRSQGLSFANEKVPVDQLVELVAETSTANSSLGAGSAGGALLGPVGQMGALATGVREPMIAFTARFLDGRQVFATTDASTFDAMKAALFDRGRKSITPTNTQSPAPKPELKKDDASSTRHHTPIVARSRPST